MTSDAARDGTAVLIGRMQPYHVGHLSVLLHSLRLMNLPHLVAFSCAGPADLIRDSREVFTPWERGQLLQVAINALGLSDRVRWIFVPRLDEKDWPGLDAYLPPGAIRCVLTGYEDEERRVRLWRQFGGRFKVLPPMRNEIVTSSEMRAAAHMGGDWRVFMHPSQHHYFLEINGPQRMGFRD